MKKVLKKCDSVAMFNEEFESMRDVISQPETEESWDAIASALINLTYFCENGAFDYPSQLIAAARSFYRPVNSAMNSERTRLSGAAIDFVTVLATGLESAFDPLLNLFFPNLLSLCTRSNKVFVSRARVCIQAIIECTQLPAVFTYLLPALKDKSVTLRIAAAEALFTCLNCFNPPELEKEARARDIEAAIRATARDANPDVRKTSRKMFEAYKVLLPNRVDRFIEPLSPTMKKYLDIKPKAQAILSNPAPRLKAAFPSLPDLKVKAKLSVSTSVLPQTTSTHTTSTTSDHGPTHVRSASAASVLPSAATASSSRDLVAFTKPERTRPPTQPNSRPRSVTQEKEKEPTTSTNGMSSATGAITKVPGSMPPPDFIPVRPKQPTPAVRVPMNPDDPRVRTTNTLSGQPMRIMIPSGSAVTGGARRVPHTQIATASTSAAATVRTGPRRPNRPMTIPTMVTAEGLMRPILPMRPASAEGGPSEAMVVGARRVPMPEPGTEGETKRGGRVISRGDNAATAARQESLAGSLSGREGMQRTTVVTGPTRATALPRAGERTRTMSKLGPRSNTTANHEKIIEAKAPTSAPTGSGGVPTNTNAEAGNARSTRGKNVTENKTGGESSKPGWGRPAPRKATTVGKEGKEKEKELEKEKKKGSEKGKEGAPGRQGSRSRNQQRPVTKPESAPLPPSPGRPTRTPTPGPVQVPLPKSPSEKSEKIGTNDLNASTETEIKNSVSTTTTAQPEVTANEQSPTPETVQALVDAAVLPQSSTPEPVQVSVDTPILAQSPPSPAPPAPNSQAVTPRPPKGCDSPATPLATTSNLEQIERTPLPKFSGESSNANTPISNLLESIQRGFLMTPTSPLSPPQTYIARAAAAAGLAPDAPMIFTMPQLMKEVNGLQFGLKALSVGAAVSGNGGTGEDGARV